MTVRAAIIGLILAAGFACWCPASALWTARSSGIGGDLVPNYVYGVVLVGVLLVNPVLGLLRGPKFRSSEWIAILSLALMGAAVTGSALLWTFPQPVIMPIHEQASNPGWKDMDILQYAPDVMLVDARATEADPNPAPIREYMQGKGRQDRAIGIGEVPWAAWAPTLAFWFAVVGLIFVGGICAAVVVHRQWSRREHLTYPIATFASELFGGEEGRLAPIYRQRVFWAGFGVSFVILCVNGLNAWFPNVPQITLGLNLMTLRDLEIVKPLMKVPTYSKYPLDIKFFFAAVGLAYFLSSEVSFSLGISGWLYVIVMAPLVARGVNMQVEMFRGGLPVYMYFGSYVGMGLMTVYLGRRFYWRVLKRAAFVPDPRGEVLPREAWAARLTILSVLLLVLVLRAAGLHPVLAVGFVLLCGLIFMMIARVNAATGLFIIQPLWHPVDILLGTFGVMALGPHAIMILAMLCAVITLDPRITVVPLVLNSLKLTEGRQAARPGRLAAWIAVAVMVAMIVGTGVAVYLPYNSGLAETAMTSWGRWVAVRPPQLVEKEITPLSDAQLAEAAKPFELSRLLLATPAKGLFVAAGAGLALVLAASALRLRFARWPIHPVMFLVWGTPWMIVYAPSFLLAWLLKGLIMKYGGQRVYAKSRRFFVGLIVGEIAAAVVWACVSILHSATTGTMAEPYSTRP